jgi:hypothetical protein
MITNDTTGNEFRLNSTLSTSENNLNTENLNAFKIADSFFNNDEFKSKNIYEIYLHLLNEEDN